MAEFQCPGCSQKVLLYEGVCTECGTRVAVPEGRGEILYCRSIKCPTTLRSAQRICHTCGTDQLTGEPASSKTLSQKNVEKAQKWG